MQGVSQNKLSQESLNSKVILWLQLYRSLELKSKFLFNIKHFAALESSSIQNCKKNVSNLEEEKRNMKEKTKRLSYDCSHFIFFPS